MSVRRAGALAALVAAALAGCGGGDDAAERLRDRVDAYARAQNEAVRKLTPDLERINRDYLAFSKGELGARAAQRRLTEAEDVVRTARDRTAALDPPAEAQELQRRLKTYMDRTVGLAEQTRRLAGYEPAARKALAPLGRVNRRLQADLADAADPAGQAEVLERYQDGLGDVVADLKAVDVPVVQRPAHVDQIRRLEQTRALSGRLRRAVIGEDPGEVARLLTRFRDQARETVPTAKLTRRGLADYEQRVDALRAASLAVRREQLRLYQQIDPR